MIHLDRGGALILTLGFVLGCAGDEGAHPADAIALRLEAGNGQVLNSAALNGVQFNGVQFNGVQFNGVQFNGVQFNGSSFTGTLETSDGPVVKAGVEFVGAEIGLTVDGVAYTLRFDDIYKDPARPDGDVYFYQVSVREDAVGTWTSLCKDHDGLPVEAIPIANYWDYTTGARIDNSDVVTFACRGAALAKCVEWGYVPWHTAVTCDGKKACSTISLQDHHQACTRMVRADYCGDGRSYTFDGTPIDIYDRLKTPLQTRSTLGFVDWWPEAEWSPNGATCVSDELRLHMYDELGIPYAYPSCLDAIDGLADCGTLANSRPASRLANAYCYQWTSDPSQCDAVHNDDKEKPK